jgi:hypothetical protein
MTWSVAAFDLLDLVDVLGLAVAGEVQHLAASARAAPCAIENSTALPRPPPASTTDSPAGISVGVPVGPITTTGSPGSQRRAQARAAAHLQHDQRQQALALSTHAPGRAPGPPSSARAARRGQRLEVLQAEELPGLEVRAPPRALHDTSTIVGVRRSTPRTVARHSSSSRR